MKQLIMLNGSSALDNYFITSVDIREKCSNQSMIFEVKDSESDVTAAKKPTLLSGIQCQKHLKEVVNLVRLSQARIFLFAMKIPIALKSMDALFHKK